MQHGFPGLQNANSRINHCYKLLPALNLSFMKVFSRDAMKGVNYPVACLFGTTDVPLSLKRLNIYLLMFYSSDRPQNSHEFMGMPLQKEEVVEEKEVEEENNNNLQVQGGSQAISPVTWQSHFWHVVTMAASQQQFSGGPHFDDSFFFSNTRAL